MAKLTRKSYKRKKVAFAAVVLGGVALVSSGFAAFVLSAGAEQNVGGGIHVGESVKGALSMEIFNVGSDGNKTGTALKGDVPDAYFSFDADGADTQGRGEHQGRTGKNGLDDYGKISNRAYYAVTNDSKNPEKLSHTFVIEIKSSIDSLSSLNVTLTTSGKDFTEPVNNCFITLPECSSSTGVTIEESVFASATADEPKDPTKVGNDSYVVTKKSDTTSGFTWTIKYTFAFDWGTRFNNMNPCYFFDNKETSATPSTGEETPRTEENEAGSGNCYGTKRGIDVDDTIVRTDWDWLREKVNGATYNINFSAQAK